MGRLSRCLLPILLLAGLAGCASTAGTPRGNDLLAMEEMAARAYRQGDYVRAADLYAGIVEAMPDQAEYWYRLGNAYARQGLSQEAALSYRQSLALDASNARGWHNLGMMQLKLANEAFAAGEARGSKRARVHAENQRLADATSRILDEGHNASVRPAPDGAPSPQPDEDADAGDSR
ncbi:tetratricopeptide repeat protein [Marilutibacter chinensis]|uniref:Tetratricopeptide repeat protein n=1 Tax=Marilutibacter chinensis TaxID=2912247 RepID=A0ABS9HYZ0_9GAMM|nr:tetratricopeptide repeat protein [Lysobacter chinensis]MCF7223593.1 tetratricopeptide repeat protein [Lysobacter chinensis]